MSNGNTTADSWVNNNESLPLLLAEEANMSNNNKNEIAGVSTKPEKTKRKQVKNACGKFGSQISIHISYFNCFLVY
jgi:hypothetical protein